MFPLAFHVILVSLIFSLVKTSTLDGKVVDCNSFYFVKWLHEITSSGVRCTYNFFFFNFQLALFRQCNIFN